MLGLKLINASIRAPDSESLNVVLVVKLECVLASHGEISIASTISMSRNDEKNADIFLCFLKTI